MSSDNSSGTGGGIGLAGALLILFIALKLTHVIDWSWWWVLAPAWIPVGIVALVLLGIVVAAAISAGRAGRRPRRTRRY